MPAAVVPGQGIYKDDDPKSITVIEVTGKYLGGR